MKFLIVTNAAGELSAWVKPVCISIVKLWPEAKVTIVLTPSQFLTGSEENYAKQLPGVQSVISVNNYWRFLLSKKADNEPGVILSLGGDLLYPVLLKWKFRFPAFAYIEKRVQWRSQYKHFFTRDEFGDLMVDSLPARPKVSTRTMDSPSFTIALLPGSRSYHMCFMVPFMLSVAKQILQVYPKIHFVWKVSPFTMSEQYTEFSKYFPLQEDFENIDLALTIPGTNTAQLAICGIPMLSIMPLNWPENIPLEGLLEYASKLPVIGMPLRRYAFKLFGNQKPNLALPNIISKQQIVPELLGVLTVEKVSECLIKLINDNDAREQMSEKLQVVMGHGGAADSIVQMIKLESGFIP